LSTADERDKSNARPFLGSLACLLLTVILGRFVDRY